MHVPVQCCAMMSCYLSLGSVQCISITLRHYCLPVLIHRQEQDAVLKGLSVLVENQLIKYMLTECAAHSLYVLCMNSHINKNSSTNHLAEIFVSVREKNQNVNFVVNCNSVGAVLGG